MHCTTLAFKLTFLVWLLRCIPLAAQETEGNVATKQDSVQDSSPPLSSRSSFPHTVRLLTRDDLRHSPYRTLPALLALEPGVVLQDGALHVRGGRAGQIAYYLDGATTTNPFFSSNSIPFIPEAVEEIQLHTGAYTAEYGGGLSGLARTRLRTGGERFEATADYRTDDFAEPGEQFLGTSAFGLRNAVVTLGGPLFTGLRYFVAGQRSYLRDREARFLEPFKFDSLTTDGTGSRPAGQLLPGPVAYERNYLPGNFYEENAALGTLAYDFNQAIKFNFSGSLSHQHNAAGREWPYALQNIFARRHAEQERKTYLANVKLTHRVHDRLAYEAAWFTSGHRFRQYDPTFGDNWLLYGDSLTNAQKGYTDFTSRFEGPLPYRIIDAFSLAHPNAPLDSYFKSEHSNMGGALDIDYHISSIWQIKGGGRYDRWTMRKYEVNTIASALAYLYGYHGETPRPFGSEYERRVRKARAGTIDSYGYDVDGNRLDEGADGPRHPTITAVYLQNYITHRQARFTAGLRYERVAMDVLMPSDWANPAFDEMLNYVVESTLRPTSAEHYFLPRFQLDFSQSPRTLFSLAYGQYVQMPALNIAYTGNRILSFSISPVTRSRYGYFGQYVGFTAKPERATQYEARVHHEFSGDLVLEAAVYYKDLQEQLRFGQFFVEDTIQVPPQLSPIFAGLYNNDASTAKGIELALAAKATNNLKAALHYTLSSVKGTGSDVTSSIVAVSDGSTRFPVFNYRLDYHHTHEALLRIDYHLGAKEGHSFWKGLDMSIITEAASGRPFTRIRMPSPLGLSTPWEVGVWPLIDRRFSYPVEPINDSTTPWTYNVDLRIGTGLGFGGVNTEIYFEVLNLLNTKNTVNVYPTTGTADDDGWLGSLSSQPYLQLPRYAEFYDAINLQNRWAYSSATGNDVYGAPRQIRVGVRVGVD